MTERSVHEDGNALPENGEKHPPTTVADGAFCELVARDLGVKVSAARTAFIGEPTERVQGIASWAMDKSPDPDERGKMILGWAKKRRAGAFRALTDEYISLAGTVGKGHMATIHENAALAHLLLQFWCANPKRLSRVLDELEIWLNVRDEGAPLGHSGNGAGE